nr:hypothetical protein [Tanacetum cinerariifolium]
IGCGVSSSSESSDANVISTTCAASGSSGPPIATQADEPMPDPAHAPNMEEPIPSLVLEPVVQPVQTHSPICSPSHLDIPSFAEAVVNEPSSSVTPSTTTAADSSQKEDISPSMTRGKLDPSKISKSPAAVAQRSVQTFVRKRSSKSTQRLDYSDVDFSPRDLVATDSSIPAEEVVPADTGVSTDESVPADQSVPADTSIPAGTCVSAEAATTTIPVNAPLDEDEPAEESSSLRRSTRKKFVAQKRTTPPSSSIPFSTDDLDAAHTVDITFASDDSDEDDTPHPIITGQPLDGLALSLWGDLKIMLDTLKVEFSSPVWQDQHK